MKARGVDVLGTLVSATCLDEAVSTIHGWIASRARHYVCVTGVHGVMESLRDGQLQTIHNRAGMVTPDGMPLVWLGWLRGLRSMGRVYGPDLMRALCDASVARGHRHFLYGGAPGVAAHLAAALRAQYPAIEIVGASTPPFRALTDEELAAVAAQINACQPDIVWVGLSTPKQERWMATVRSQLHAPVLIGVGAAFDFLAGLKPQAPRWMQRLGLEWLFRLITEPRRLWKRYLRNNPLFLAHVFLQLSGLRRYQRLGAR